MRYKTAYYCVGCGGFVKELRQYVTKHYTEYLTPNENGTFHVSCTEQDSMQDDDTELSCNACGCSLMEYKVTKEVIDMFMSKWVGSDVFPCRRIYKDRQQENIVITMVKLMEHLL